MNRRRRPAYRSRRRGKGEDTGALRLLVLSTVILLAVIFKTVTGVGAVAVYNEISAAVTGEQTYSQAISALGQAIVSGTKENAIMVFGEKITGLEPKSDEPQPQNNATENTDPPMVNELPKDVEETATKSRVLTDPAFAFAEPTDYEVLQLSLIENQEEYADDTLDEPFEMPTPDLVDNNKYTIPFPVKVPVKGKITSPFGYRVHPITEETTFHYGIDIAGGAGTDIGAFANGTVVERGVSTIFGNYVKVQHSDGYLSFYAHLSKITVKKGQTVKMGAKIGLVGSTGMSTGPHLHFEVRRNGKTTNPQNYLN